MSSDRTIEQLNKRDALASANHVTAREAARLHGNEMQLRLLGNKMGGLSDEDHAELLHRTPKRTAKVIARRSAENQTSPRQ